MNRWYERRPLQVVWRPWRFVNAYLRFLRWEFIVSLGWHNWSLGVALSVAGEDFHRIAVAAGPLTLEVRRWRP